MKYHINDISDHGLKRFLDRKITISDIVDCIYNGYAMPDRYHYNGAIRYTYKEFFIVLSKGGCLVTCGTAKPKKAQKKRRKFHKQIRIKNKYLT